MKNEIMRGGNSPRICYFCFMPTIRNEDEPDVVWLSLPLDLRTFAWLSELAEHCHGTPEAVAASLLRDVKADDEDAHERGRAFTAEGTALN